MHDAALPTITPAAERTAAADGGAASTVRRVHPLVADLLRPRPTVYYADTLASAAVGWSALFATARLYPSGWAAATFAVAVLALYRATSFIHELTHLRPGAVPGFDTAWNAVVGVPLLLPSMLYAGGVHGVHHSKAHYGTPRDPEYLPIGWWPAWKRWGWVVHAALLPVALVLRFLVLAPASLLHPSIRRFVWARASSLSVNPAFARAPPPPELRARFLVQEVAASAWAVALAVVVATRPGAQRLVAVAVVAAAAVGVLNQLRTLVAHRFLNASGDTLGFEQQFQDSVNVPGDALTTLWAPVGLRYHALHHLLPGLPYHALGAAHRRIVKAMPEYAPYRRVNERGLLAALRSARGARSPRS